MPAAETTHFSAAHITNALIRQYLKHYELKETLKTLQQEQSVLAKGITNKKQLFKALEMDEANIDVDACSLLEHVVEQWIGKKQQETVSKTLEEVDLAPSLPTFDGNLQEQTFESEFQLSPFSFTELITLRWYLFGAPPAINDAVTLPNKMIPEGWLQQCFHFSSPIARSSELDFGLVQHRGGPCGLLAAVQAQLFKASRSGGKKEVLLLDVLSEIVWRIKDKSNNENCYLVIHEPSSATATKTSVISATLNGILCTWGVDKFTQNCKIIALKSLTELRKAFQKYEKQFTIAPSHGCLLFLMSAILTAGNKALYEAMDDPLQGLIVKHGYCCQELVHLLLFGKALSSVHDGERDVGGLILRGVEYRQEIGFLSLHEHYKAVEVGSYFKNPLLPIWIICSESHYSVLYGKNDSNETESPFDLFYYDGLANQEELIRLTICKRLLLDFHSFLDPTPPNETSQLERIADNPKLIPPLELCLRTRWPDCVVDWHKTEPLL